MLSILICTLVNRERQLSELMNVLSPQLSNAVEILTEQDNGELSIGAKRNILLSRATKKYCAFVDDDDLVSSDYVIRIFNAIKEGLTTKGGYIDCVGICGYLVENNKRTWQIRHSITVGRWCKDRNQKIYYRTPNHLNPVRSEIAKRIKFPETSWGEDRGYSDAIKPLLHSEVFIETPIYFYKIYDKKSVQ